MNETIAMQNESTYRNLSVSQGRGPRVRKRTPEQRARLRRQAARDQQETVVALSAYLPRPLTYAWEDGRIGRQRWWGNLIRRAEEVVDAPEPPPFAVTFKMAEVLAWMIIDLYTDRGLSTELPDPDPVQRALGVRRAA